MDALGGKHVRLDQLIQRQQRGRAGSDVIRHGGERNLDPFAVILLALAVERLMVGVLRDQDHRQQARPRIAACDRVERRRRLRDPLAGAAGELLAHMLGHEPAPRLYVERLGDVLADLRQLGAAAARACRRCRINDALPRQVRREAAAYRLAPRMAFNRNARLLDLDLVLGGRRDQFLELQLQLVEQPLTALRTRAEVLALHLRNRELEVLDQRLGAGKLGARLDQRCSERFFAVRELIRCPCHARDCSTSHIDSRRKSAT